jgi:TolB protein
MKSRLLTNLLTIITLAAPLAVAQDVPKYDLGEIGRAYEPLKIGVEDARYIGDRYITGEDSSLMNYVTIVVQRDLNFYADFELVLLDTFYLTTYEITEMDLLGWQRLGADYAVKLEAEFPGPNVKIFWRLYDTGTKSQITKGTLEYKREFWRELAHDIANEIVYILTGDPGIFRTKIAYIKKIEDAKEVCVADYNGTNERQLTNSGTINISPVFSPDGEKIYFTSYLGGDPQLYRVSVRNGEIEKITDFPGIAAAPAVSPDGNKIACVLSKDGNSEIYVLDLEGNIIKRLTRHRAIDSSPTWSPDGRMIAFSSDRTGTPQVYIMDSDGLNTRRLTYQGGYNDSPIWSQRGDRITFVSRTPDRRFNLASIDTSGADFHKMTEVGHNENPHFSPDGKHIVFSSSRLSETDIYTMDLSGRNQRRVTRTASCSNPTWGPIK